MNNQALFVFTKYPERGKVKTRLAKVIGNEKAYFIYIQLVNSILSQVLHLAKTDVYIYFDKLPISYPKDLIKINAKLKEQKGVTIGDKMLNAFIDGEKKGYEKMLLIGCDIYQLTYVDLIQAFLMLNKADVVLGKANDGGYYLIGMKKAHNRIFSLNAWSHNKVLEQTLNIISDLGLNVSFSSTKTDVDTIDDLKQTDLYNVFC